MGLELRTNVLREDAVQIIALAADFVAESRYADEGLVVERFWNFFGMAVREPKKFLVVYGKVGDTVTGFFMGAMQTRWFSDRPMAVDCAIYVGKEHRGGMLFVRMLRKFEEWAKENGAEVVGLGHSSGIDVEKTKAIFTRMGYSCYGNIYDKEI